MTAENNKYDTILDLFKLKNDNRPIFEKPFFHKGLAIATDMYSMVFFDSKLCSEKEPFSGKENMLDFMPKERNQNFAFTIDVLKNTIGKCPLKDELKIVKASEKCDACMGEGEVTYEFFYAKKDYEIERDCPVCDGEGVTKEQLLPTGNKIPDLEHHIQIKDAMFLATNLSKLINVCEILNEPDIVLVYANTPISIHIFKIGLVEIMIVPINDSSAVAVSNIQ